MQENEIDWVIRAKSEDTQAFSLLVDAYQAPVFNLCYRMLGDRNEAEDAAQETFLRAFKSLDKYHSTRPFSTWVLSIAAHYCIDQMRRRRIAMVPIEDLPYQQVSDPLPDPELVVSKNEDQQQVRTLLSFLSPSDRAAVVMRYWHDFSYDEIAEALDMSISAVKSRLHRARRVMARQWLNQSNHILQIKGARHESPVF